MPAKFQSFMITNLTIFIFFFMGLVKAWGGDIQMKLEEPSPDKVSVYSGVANIRGWAVGSKEIVRVKLFIDGRYENDIPVGGDRSDVYDHYPNYPNSRNSGFSMAFNYSNMSAGTHSISVQAIDTDGTIQQIPASFQVVRFDNSYTDQPVNLNNVRKSGNSIFFNINVEGKSYSVQLDWREEAQGYIFTQITN